MSAIPHPRLWTPWARPAHRPSLRDRRAWWRKLVDPLAAYAAGDPLVDSSGNPLVDSHGNPMVDDGRGNPCCRYQARKCSDNSLAGIYLKKSQFPSFPSTYYFKYSGICYYVQSTDTAACNSTPLVTGETAVSSCADAACGCPGSADWASLPSSLVLSGWESLGNCGAYPYQANSGYTSCVPPNPAWGGVYCQGNLVYGCGGGPSGPGGYVVHPAGIPDNGYFATFSDGNTWLVPDGVHSYLQCFNSLPSPTGHGGSQGWAFAIYVNPCTPSTTWGYQADAFYYKLGSDPRGTYTYYGQDLVANGYPCNDVGGVVFPSTMTFS